LILQDQDQLSNLKHSDLFDSNKQKMEDICSCCGIKEANYYCVYDNCNAPLCDTCGTHCSECETCTCDRCFDMLVEEEPVKYYLFHCSDCEDIHCEWCLKYCENCKKRICPYGSCVDCSPASNA
jgi:hypothetical protein